MKDISQAAFSLDHYKVSKFSFFEPIDDSEEISIKFRPSGRYNSQNGEFVLSFNFQATSGEQERQLIEATMDAFFKFRKSIDAKEIPEYFYKNSLAIVFPYLRAFISTLTAVANTKPLILPLMNLSMLEEPLRSNTTFD